MTIRLNPNDNSVISSSRIMNRNVCPTKTWLCLGADLKKNVWMGLWAATNFNAVRFYLQAAKWVMSNNGVLNALTPDTNNTHRNAL